MKNSLTRGYHSYVIFIATLGILISLLPYLVPEPFLTKINLFFYGPEYGTRGLANLNEHPVHEHAHRIIGAIFVLSGLIQFSDKIRKQYRKVHRFAGYFFALCVLAMAVGGIIMAVLFPFAGSFETYSFTAFGLTLLYVTFVGFKHIFKKNWVAHQQWMIRSFLLSLSTITMRVVAFPLIKFSLISIEDIFNSTFWIGFMINLLIAQAWARSLEKRPIKIRQRVAVPLFNMAAQKKEKVVYEMR